MRVRCDVYLLNRGRSVKLAVVFDHPVELLDEGEEDEWVSLGELEI